MATTSSFNFNDYNAVMATANSGLKLYLAEQMLKDVQATMLRYRSPLLKDMNDIVDELDSLRTANKKLALARETSVSGEIDNSTLESPKSTSADAGKVDGSYLPEASL